MRWVDILADDDDIVAHLAQLIWIISVCGIFSHIDCRKVSYLMAKLNLKEWLGTALVHVEKVGTVRQWKQWCFDLTS